VGGVVDGREVAAETGEDGERCEPRHLAHVCRAVAHAQGRSYDQVAKITSRTAKAFFGLGLDDQTGDGYENGAQGHGHGHGREGELPRHHPSCALPLEAVLSEEELAAWYEIKRQGRSQNRIERGELEKEFLLSLTDPRARASLRRARKHEVKRARELKHEREREARAAERTWGVDGNTTGRSGARRAAEREYDEYMIRAAAAAVERSPDRSSQSRPGVRWATKPEVYEVPNQQTEDRRGTWMADGIREASAAGDQGGECAICLGECEVPERLKCGHVFCRNCLNEQRRHPQVTKACALCRGPLTAA